jgi:Cdc6-like AAA superfamily ATPase
MTNITKPRKWSAAQKRYSNSALGKAARLKYQTSIKGQATRAAYMARRKAKLAGKEQVEAITPVEIKEEASKIEKEVVSNK